MLANEMSQLSNNWLIADVGATTSRCAILSAGKMSQLRIVSNADAASLHTLLTNYLEECNERPASIALAVAAPIDGDEVEMMNRDWRFSGSSIKSLGFSEVRIINDFHALAHALPTLDDESRLEIGKASQYRDGNIAVLGPGSGLGVSAWIDGKAAMSGEGGHITVSGRTPREDEIIARLRDRFGHCSAERILSGPGIIALHEAMHSEIVATAEEITANPANPDNLATMRQFFAFLGSVAADLALITGAYGGVYIAGGIVPACTEQISQSGFRARFEDKNRYRDYMRAIPTWVVTDPVPGLTGLAAYLDD